LGTQTIGCKECKHYLNKSDLSTRIIRDGQTSFALRDPIGIESIYFTKKEKGYLFSKKIDDLFRISKLFPKPNLKSLKSMLYHRTVDYFDTMYEGVGRLPPGYCMLVENGKVYIERYWFPENIKINKNISEEEASEKIRKLLSSAIENNIEHLEKTAFEVSGGLDSSSIVSLLCQSVSAHDIDSYSINFDTWKCDEREYVESLLSQYPLNHQCISAFNLDYKDKYSLKNLYTLEKHWPITGTFAMYLPMLEKMKQDGKNCVITGQGGDHLFTGSRYVLYNYFREFRWIELYRELYLYPKPWNTAKAYILLPLLGDKTVSFLKKYLLKKGEENPFFTENNEIAEYSQSLCIKDLAHLEAIDTLTSSFNATILDGGPINSARDNFGLDYRHPYFDLELVEFVLSLPEEMKYKHRTIKWILRKAMDGILPNKIKNRDDKANFREPIIQQIEAVDIGALLNDPYIVKLGLIDLALIDKYRKEYEKDKTQVSLVLLWVIINVEYWYRFNFESETLV